MQDISFSINKNIALVNAEELLEIIKTVNITYNAIPDFEILFYAKDSTESYKVYKILDKSETDKYDYNIYGYNGIVNIKIDGNEYSLKEALLENKITMEEIIQETEIENITNNIEETYNGIITNINSNSIVFEDKSRNKKYSIDVNSSLNF